MNELILNKIKHKPLLIEKIFPFTTKRPLIFQILLKSDLTLKDSLKNAFKSLKKNNNLDNETNEIFYKFKAHLIMFEKNLYEEYLLNIQYICNILIDDSYTNFFDRFFFQVLMENINEKHELLYNETYNNFVLDFFQYHKKLCLYIFPNGKSNLELLKKIKIKNNEINIDLIFFLDGISLENTNSDSAISELVIQNLKIKNIYFVYIEHNTKNEDYLFCLQILKYIEIINNLKNKDGIKKINLKYLGDKITTFIEQLINNKLYFNLKGLEKVEYNDDNKKLNLYQRFDQSYNLFTIFNKKLFFNLIIITPDDFNGIKELNEDQKNNLKNKLNIFEKNNTDLKILLIDFENNSPYQENFIYFCENYLSYNKTINTVRILNFGKINYNNDYKKIIKKPIINLERLNKIAYENQNLENNEDEIKEFISLFFNLDNLAYQFSVFIKFNNLKYLFYSNELILMDLKSYLYSIDLFNNDTKIKIYFDNIFYELYFYNNLKLIKSNTDKELYVPNIIKLLKIIKKSYQNLKLTGEIDIINKINFININSKILTDENQCNIIINELKTFGQIFRIHKIFDESINDINLKKFRKKLMKKKANKLIIFKTKKSDIFGFFHIFTKFHANNNFIFSNNINIINNKLFYDYIHIEHGSLYIKNYVSNIHLINYINKLILKKNDSYLVDYAEIYYLKELV